MSTTHRRCQLPLEDGYALIVMTTFSQTTGKYRNCGVRNQISRRWRQVWLRSTTVRLPARPPERALDDAVVALLAQAASVPPVQPLILSMGVQIVRLGLVREWAAIGSKLHTFFGGRSAPGGLSW